jgi:hypothetical protein
MSVHNPSTMFGIHVSSSSIRLMYSEIAIATGQVPIRAACKPSLFPLPPSYQSLSECMALSVLSLIPAAPQVLPGEEEPPRRRRDPARREDAAVRSRRHARGG